MSGFWNIDSTNKNPHQSAIEEMVLLIWNLAKRLNLIEDGLPWRTTFNGRHPLNGRKPLMENDL